MENLFIRTYFQLCASLIICENLSFLWKSFWILLTCETLFLFMIIWKIYFLKFLWKQASSWIQSSKQIFYHQNTIMIFCWFRMFQFCFFLYITINNTHSFHNHTKYSYQGAVCVYWRFCRIIIFHVFVICFTASFSNVRNSSSRSFFNESVHVNVWIFSNSTPVIFKIASQLNPRELK